MTLSILSHLLDSPDPVPEDESEDDAANSDPPDRALNSVRGQAMRAMMAFIGWWIGAGRTEDDVPPQFLELVTSGLDPSHEPSAAVRSVYGEHVPRLHAYLPRWTSEHLEAIFGPSATDQEVNPKGRPTEPLPPTPAEQLGQVAFDAYLLLSRPYGQLWELLEV